VPVPGVCIYCEAPLRERRPACPACGRFQQMHWARTPLLRGRGERVESPPQPRLIRLRRRFVRWIGGRSIGK
jgi:predicted amidophosphoribosyltransferase